MNVFLVTDDEAKAAEARRVLLREGINCPASNVLRIERAPRHLSGTPADLTIVVLPVEPERSLAVLEWVETLPRGDGERVLAIGPAADPKVVLRALRGAVDDYLDESDLDAELTAAIGRWRACRAKHTEAGRVIAVLAPSGGSGASTLAANVAAVLAGRHESVALIDLKLHAGDLAALLDLRPTHTLADLCANASRMDRALFERSLVRHASGVSLLAPPRHYEDIARITPDGVGQTIALAKGSFPYVLLDLDSSFRPEQVEALRQADLVVLVLRLDFVSLRNARRAIEHLERLGIGRDRIRLVVNRYGQPKEVPAVKAEEALGMKVFHYVPDDPKSVNRANNNGVPVVLEAPRAAVSRSVAKLAHGVNGRHKAD